MLQLAPSSRKAGDQGPGGYQLERWPCGKKDRPCWGGGGWSKWGAPGTVTTARVKAPQEPLLEAECVDQQLKRTQVPPEIIGMGGSMKITFWELFPGAESRFTC